MEEKIVYFEEPGQINTEETLRLAAERAKARGINKIVLASTRGETARIAAKIYAGSGLKMVVVPHQYSFMQQGQRFPKELVEELAQQGHVVHFSTMLFHTEGLYGMNVGRVIADTLRTFCQGMKVAMEIVLMAADGGKVDAGEKVVCVTGTGRGADTAVVVTASTSNRLAEFHITEIICKPLQTKQGPPPPMPGQVPPGQTPPGPVPPDRRP
jgi:uncharacterized protein